MSSRYKVNPFQTTGGLATGLEGIDIPEDFELPSCGVEDVDRAMFKLFNEDIPLFYEQEGNMKRIPCIFAGGERAMILRRKQPLRDRQGALILPLVSILRSGIDQETEAGIGPGDGTMTIKKRLAKEDRQYKKLANIDALRNQDNVKGTATYKSASLNRNIKNVYEVITIPSPRFFKATYEITFWAQYLQQMNHMVEAFISSYNINPARSFKIETNKGYWFVAQVESGLSDSTNFDGYADDERSIKTSLTISVTGYIINPKYPGAPSPIRRYVSAPKVQFETQTKVPNAIASSMVPSSNPDDYIFEDLSSVDHPLPGGGIAAVSTTGPEYSVNIGGEITNNSSNRSRTVQSVSQRVKVKDPFDGTDSLATVKSKNLSKGETVYIIIETLNQE